MGLLRTPIRKLGESLFEHRYRLRISLVRVWPICVGRSRQSRQSVEKDRDRIKQILFSSCVFHTIQPPSRKPSFYDHQSVDHFQKNEKITESWRYLRLLLNTAILHNTSRSMKQISFVTIEKNPRYPHFLTLNEQLVLSQKVNAGF